MVLACISQALYSAPYKSAQDLNYTILTTTNHNPHSFTQGLERYGPYLFESSGLYSKSFITAYNNQNGQVSQLKKLPKSIFAEGLTVFKQRIYVLSWKAQTAYLFDTKTFAQIKTLPYRGQGWGLSHNETQLIMSDGSDTLKFLDPKTLSVERTINVSSDNKRWKNINELEYARGLIWANIWKSAYIIAINPSSGQVEGIVDLSVLVEKNTQIAGYDVLNGIAYNAEDDSFWITGKLWHKRYRIRVQQPTPH